jgi:hypothetical protein
MLPNQAQPANTGTHHNNNQNNLSRAAQPSAAAPEGANNPFEAQQIRIAGHWKVLKKIGSGAFGDIYLGTSRH